MIPRINVRFVRDVKGLADGVKQDLAAEIGKYLIKNKPNIKVKYDYPKTDWWTDPPGTIEMEYIVLTPAEFEHMANEMMSKVRIDFKGKIDEPDGGGTE
jgi:hypothetical protein